MGGVVVDERCETTVVVRVGCVMMMPLEAFFLAVRDTVKLLHSSKVLILVETLYVLQVQEAHGGQLLHKLLNELVLGQCHVDGL